MASEKFYIVTLGCKVNQYESQALRESWTALGHEEAESLGDADVALLNSCAITEKAVSDLRAAVRRVRREAPGCRVLVTGCAAQSLAGEVRAMGVDGIVPQRDKTFLLAGPDAPGPEKNLAEASGRGSPGNAGRAGSLGSLPENAALKNERPENKTGTGGNDFFPPFHVSGYVRSRAVLKVQDGCSHNCAYCIVPSSRGGSSSRRWPEVLAEAGRLADAGFGEIILNGVNLRQYDCGGEDFWDLLQRLEAALAPEWAGRLRFRISSLEPGQLGEKALETLAQSRLAAPHLHISLQSGSPAVLREMRRGHYDPETIPAFLEKLKEIWPVYGLGADIIAGFPGETEETFAETLAFCSRLPLTYAHVFPYSRRPGTIAAKMPDQVPAGVKKERAAALRGLVAAKKQFFLRSLLELPAMMMVLEDSEKQRGVNEFYAECRLLDGASVAPKALAAVRPVRLEKDVLLVRPA